MAHHKSAKKRIRRNARANVNNSQYLSTVRTAVKKFRAAVSSAVEGKPEAAVRPLFETAQSLLAKAAAKGIIHSNNAARKIGRMSVMLKHAEAGTQAPAAAKAKAKKSPAKKATAKPAAAKPAAAPKAAAKKPAKKSAE